MKVSNVTEDNIILVQAFLENNSDTSLFLSSNLSVYGPGLGDSMNSGNFKFLESDNNICAVFCLTRRGNLLAETRGRTNFAKKILDACTAESISIQGVIGEWYSSDAIWKLLLQSGNFIEYSRSREVLYRLDLTAGQASAAAPKGIRQLLSNDFEQWEPLETAFLQEEGMPIQGTIKQRRANFEQSARAGYWWGYIENGQLMATVALNALYKQTGQVGGVYTAPLWRRRGLSRAAMQVMIKDCMHLYHLRKLILFTGENNKAARCLYESLGFIQIGYYALFFGSSGTNKS